MQQKNLRAVDLNLLVILDALLDERSVTRAAARLFLTQPAASHALDRLRALFADPLLERRGTTMALTAKAEELQAPVRAVLDDVRRLVRTRDIPLRDLRATVHLAMADYPAAVVVPLLWARLQKTAPGLALVVHAWTDHTREQERLRRGEVGLALSTLPVPPDDIEREHVADEHYVGVTRKGHPLGRTPTLAQFVAYPHVLVSATGARTSPFDARLAERGQKRTVGISLPSFLAVPSVVLESDAIAMIPRSIARHWAPARPLAQFKLPLDPGTFTVDLAWHKRRSHDVAVQAVRKALSAIVARLLRYPVGSARASRNCATRAASPSR
jgi:DNA-binding transcriptional LysR family regulator